MVIHIQKTCENVLIVSVFFLAIFFGEFISKVLYTVFRNVQGLFFKKYTLVFYRFSTVINRVMRIS